MLKVLVAAKEPIVVGENVKKKGQLWRGKTPHAGDVGLGRWHLGGGWLKIRAASIAGDSFSLIIDHAFIRKRLRSIRPKACRDIGEDRRIGKGATFIAPFKNIRDPLINVQHGPQRRRLVS